MVFEIKTVSNYGTRNIVVARLKIQIHDLVQWANLPTDRRKQVVAVYGELAERLIKCHEVYDRLLAAHNTALDELRPNPDPRIKSVPHLIDLSGEIKPFLYESKNFLRELLRVINIFFGTGFHTASVFCALAGKRNENLVEWATKKFGTPDPFTTMLVTEQDWAGELIRKRNAVEHPGGRSGALDIENFKSMQDGGFVPPVWHRDREPPTEILHDLETYLDNLLTLAEDMLVSCIFHTTPDSIVQFVEIPEKDRASSCPVRLRIQLDKAKIQT